MNRVFLLDKRVNFPSPHLASKEGLLALGGDLSPERLCLAYRMGIFPWFSENEPIMWWSPDPRLVLFPQDLKISKSLAKVIKKGKFTITMDNDFVRVMEQCAMVRTEKGEETWITGDMVEAYSTLHEKGLAHSVEAWYGNELVGGLYGVSLGKCFFGESMFTRKSNASKVAFVALVEYLKSLSFDFIDCQVTTEHLMRFGAREISRKRFLALLTESLKLSTISGQWG